MGLQRPRSLTGGIAPPRGAADSIGMGRAVCALPLLAVVALAFAGLLPAGAGAARTDTPQILLVAPANGSLVESGKPVAFTWRVSWLQPPASGTVMLVHRLASDSALTQNVTTTTQSCPVSNSGCWSSFKPNAAYKGRYYWQVSMVGAAQATSATWMFMAVEPAPEVDRIRPYVRTYTGGAKRGTRAIFTAQVRDNTGQVRMRALLTYRGLPVMEGRTQFSRVVWRVRQRFHSIRPLPRRLPAGVYKICVTAWDRAGNQGRSCARYKVS